MILAAHQPYFAPYPGFFRTALAADVVVLLDGVQFPRGTTWVTRNRFKSHDGELWLTIPVWKKGRGLQQIRDVEICYDGPWVHKHLKSLGVAYRHAPYYDPHGAFLEKLYSQGHRHLIALNVAILRHVWEHIGLPARLVLQSDLGVRGAGTVLLLGLCRAVGADVFIAQKSASKYLDATALTQAGIAIRHVDPRPIVYPQLWGPFLPRLSILDMLFTCGPASRQLLRTGADRAEDGADAAEHAQGVPHDRAN